MSINIYYEQITPIILEIYKKFSFIKKDIFDRLCDEVKEKFNQAEIASLSEYKSSFERELKRVLYTESQKLFYDPKTMKDSLNMYINLNFKVGNSYQENFSVISSFCNSLTEMRFVPEADALMAILQNNIIEQIVKDVVDNNIEILNSKGISSITSNPVLEVILETYCDSINIDLGNEDVEYSDDNYKSVPTIEIPNLPVLTKEEERKLLQLAQDGDKKAREKLILHNLKLVSKIASHSKSKRIPFEDLFQQGYFGLEEAINRFDLTTDYKFSTYATCWIRNKITRYVCDNDRTIRLPVHIIGEVIPKINKIQSQMYEVLGREPSYDELYAEVNKTINIPRNRFLEIYRVRNEPASLDFKIGEDEDTELYNFVGEEDLSGEDKVFNEQLRATLYSIFDQMNLSARERNIIILRFGLNNQKRMTLEELGLMYNVKRERIRQIEAKVLSRLKNPKYKKYLLPFIKYYETVDSSPVDYNNSFIPNESFYEFFIRNGLTSEEIDMALNDMPGDFKYYLNSIFKEKNANRTIKDYFYHVIVPFMINTNKDNPKEQNNRKWIGTSMKKRKITNIYSFFENEGYTEEQIDFAISRWPEKYSEIVKQGFGTDLKNPTLSPWTSQSQFACFNNTIIPETRKMLQDETYTPHVRGKRRTSIIENEQIHINDTQKKPTNEVKNTVQSITSFKMISLPSFEDFLMKYSIRDIVITSLCLGGIDGVVHSIESIIQFLRIDSSNWNCGKVQSILEEYKIECNKSIDLSASKNKDSSSNRPDIDSKDLCISSLEEYLKTKSLMELSIVGLNLGYVTGFFIDSKSISKFLSLDNEYVISIIKNSLTKYKEDTNKVIDRKIDSLKTNEKVPTKRKIILNN